MTIQAGTHFSSTKAMKAEHTQDLVRQGIHENAEVGDQLTASGDGAIEVIGDTGGDEQDQGEGLVEGKTDQQRDEEEPREHEARDGQLVRKVHRQQTGATRLSVVSGHDASGQPVGGGKWAD
jgi:hypothetical protein